MEQSMGTVIKVLMARYYAGFASILITTGNLNHLWQNNKNPTLALFKYFKNNLEKKHSRGPTMIVLLPGYFGSKMIVRIIFPARI